MKSQDKYFSFRFAINLHIDDTATLELIQAKLGVGKVYIRGSLSSFIVKSTDDINIIIQIFTDYPLNTHKHLNFLAWKKAFFIYNNSSYGWAARDPRNYYKTSKNLKVKWTKVD